LACCALAAFLISQIIFGLDWLRERMGLTDPERAVGNAVVAWRLDAAVVAPIVRPPAPRSALASRLRLAAVGGGIAFVMLAALTLRAGPTRSWDAFALICTGHGLERLASLRIG
jgi:hypothetical protein